MSLTLNDGVAVGTIAGGIAGFLSFVVVVVDKLTTRPKLQTSVRRATYRSQTGGIYQGPQLVSFSVSLEIGNVGSEATTVTRVNLKLDDGQILHSVEQLITAGFTLVENDYKTHLCEKGFAFIEDFKFRADGIQCDAGALRGTLIKTSEKIDVKHYLMVDSHFTWWDCGKSYLCRIIDMLHMGYVDEVFFGKEILSELPRAVKEWVALNKARKKTRNI